MPEVIYCPSGGHKLRVAEEMLGQVVQCPICGLVFTAPTRGPVSATPMPPPEPRVVLPHTGPSLDWAGRPHDARSQLLAPATGLVIVSMFTALMGIFQAVYFGAKPGEAQRLNEMYRAFLGFDPQLTPQGLALFGGFLAALNLLICHAAIQMLRLRTYWWAVIGSILAWLPMQCPCCLFSLPLGVWALVVLSRPDVRDLFRRGIP